MKETREQVVFPYNRMALKSEIAAIIQRHLPTTSWDWLTEKIAAIEKNENIQPLAVAFAAIPRKTGKNNIIISSAENEAIQKLRSGFSIVHWRLDRLCRVWLLMHIDADDEAAYIRAIENLFKSAEMNEQVALYSALPILAYPHAWEGRCADGIRSNIGDVLESIMCHNPYPSENLDEPAWNQLVLKAIFTEKPIHHIVNLDERANQNLADTLSDYAHERWAAHRMIHPLLWRCVSKFINDDIFPDLQRIARSEHSFEREAAALACVQSPYKPAVALVEENAELKSIVKSGITWADIAEKFARVV